MDLWPPVTTPAPPPSSEPPINNGPIFKDYYNGVINNFDQFSTAAPELQDPLAYFYSTTTTTTTENPIIYDPYNLYPKLNKELDQPVQFQFDSELSTSTTTKAPFIYKKITITTTKSPYAFDKFFIRQTEPSLSLINPSSTQSPLQLNYLDTFAKTYQTPVSNVQSFPVSSTESSIISTSISTRNPIFDLYLNRAKTTRSPYNFDNFAEYFKTSTPKPKFAFNLLGSNHSPTIVFNTSAN